MAQTNSVAITNFKSIGYNADVEVSKSGFAITGKIGMDGDKKIVKYDGTVIQDNQRVCSFNSYQRIPANGESGLAYNISDIFDAELASQAILAISASVADIQAEVDEN